MSQFKTKCFEALMGLAIGATVCLSGSAEPIQYARAIWMWEAASFEMLDHAHVAADNMAFMKAKGITTLYLYADSFEGQTKITSQKYLYATLIKRLHKEGFQVYALLGSWYLKTQGYVWPSERQAARRMFQRVLEFNASVEPEAQFDGINLDIEPHMLDEWDTRQLTLLSYWIDLSHDLMQLKKASRQSLMVGPAIPFWLDGIQINWGGISKPVSEHLQDVYDYVAIMDYRDRAEGQDGMISHAANEIAYANRIGKKVMIGIETGPNEIQKVSFNHLREDDMKRELGKVESVFSKEAAFSGFVIHHFGTYRKWLQQQGP
jgi:hypothetical protein